MKDYDTSRQDTGGNIIRRMRISCWITTATDARLFYVIFIAVTSQELLHRRTSVLQYTYIATLVESL